MARILTISIPDDADWVYDAVMEKVGTKGSKSGVVVEMLKEQLLAEEHPMAVEKMRPYWFVETNDYSHLAVSVQERLVKFGYVLKKEKGDGSEQVAQNPSPV